MLIQKKHGPLTFSGSNVQLQEGQNKTSWSLVRMHALLKAFVEAHSPEFGFSAVIAKS